MAEKLGITTLAALYEYSANKFAAKQAFATRDAAKNWAFVNYADVLVMGKNLAAGLIDLGMQAKEHVGVLADNRLEWIISDCAIQLSGCANVPRGTDVTDDDISYIISHSDAKIVFVE